MCPDFGIGCLSTPNVRGEGITCIKHPEREKQRDSCESSISNVKGDGTHVNQEPHWDEILVTSFILSNAKHGKMHAVNLDQIDLIDHQTQSIIKQSS